MTNKQQPDVDSITISQPFAAQIVKAQNGMSRLEIQSQKYYQHQLNKFRPGEMVTLVVSNRRPKRTQQQNRYYWGVVVKMISEEMGIIPDEAHELLKGLFLKVGIEFKGKRYEAIKSTAGLSIKEFEEYCESCRRWALSELNTNIPLPGEIDLEL